MSVSVFNPARAATHALTFGVVVNLDAEEDQTRVHDQQAERANESDADDVPEVRKYTRQCEEAGPEDHARKIHARAEPR